jgi:hypothetical protein
MEPEEALGTHPFSVQMLPREIKIAKAWLAMSQNSNRSINLMICHSRLMVGPMILGLIKPKVQQHSHPGWSVRLATNQSKPNRN